MTRLLPGYAWLPLAGVLAVNTLVYNGTRIINAGRMHFSMWTAVDDVIPFVTATAFIYVLAFVQWGIGYLLAGRESPEVCMRFYMADICAKGIALIFFLTVPTMITRPEVTGEGLFDALTRLIYRIDAPDNLFPSIHCLESWICFRSALSLKKVPRWYAPASLVFTLLVFASTVMLKQHVFVDIPGGVFAAEAGLILSDALQLGRRSLPSKAVRPVFNTARKSPTSTSRRRRWGSGDLLVSGGVQAPPDSPRSGHLG